MHSSLVEKLPGRTVNTLLFIVIFLWFGVIGGLMLIEKPDIVKGKLKVVTNEQPISVVACNTGTLIFCNSTDSTVKKGDLLAYIDNLADKDVVFALERILNTYSGIDLYDSLHSISSEHLGELSYSYLNLKDAILQLDIYKSSRLSQIERDKAVADISFIQATISEKKDALQSLALRLALAKEQLETDSLLYAKNAILKQDYHNSQNNYLALNGQFIQLQSDLTHLNQQRNDAKSTLSYNLASDNETIEKLNVAIDNQLQVLLADIGQWKENYLMYALSDGQLERTNFVESYQAVNKGGEVMRILPNLNHVRALLYYSGPGSGNVSPDSKIKLYLDDFNRNEAGYLVGTFESISSSSHIDEAGVGHYAATIRIDMSEQPTFKGDFRFAHNMTGEAEIIVKGKRLFFEIFGWMQTLLVEP